MREKRRPAGRALPDAVWGSISLTFPANAERMDPGNVERGDRHRNGKLPSHIRLSSSWATAESEGNISRGKKGVLSACRHEMHHVGSKTWARDKPCRADSMGSASFLELHQGCSSCSELEGPETKAMIWRNRTWNDKKEIKHSILPFDRGHTLMSI